MTTYDKAPKEVNNLVRTVRDDIHKDLKSAGVKFLVLMATEHSPDLAAVKLAGFPVVATIKALDHKTRVMLDCKADAMIIIDDEKFTPMTLKSKRAVIDHVLTQLTPQTDKDGNVKLDDRDRPKLKRLQPDIRIAGFAEVIERNEHQAPEAIQMLEALARIPARQQLFPFAVDQDDAPQPDESQETTDNQADESAA